MQIAPAARGINRNVAMYSPSTARRGTGYGARPWPTASKKTEKHCAGLGLGGGYDGYGGSQGRRGRALHSAFCNTPQEVLSTLPPPCKKEGKRV